MITRRALLASLAVSPFFMAFKSSEDIKIGVCTRDCASAAKYGFDYIEPAAAEIAVMSDDEFRDYSEEVLASPIRCWASNSIIRRPDLIVGGEDASSSGLTD